MFRRLSVRTKLMLVIVTALVAVVAVTLVAVNTISAVSISGDVAQRRSQVNELAAAVEPPKQRLVEAQLLVNQLVEAPDVAAGEPLIQKLDAIRDSYYQDHLELMAELEAHPVAPGTKLGSLVADDSYAPAVLYWDAYRSELVPLVMAGDFDAAREVLDKKLQPNYDKHIAALESARKLIAPAKAAAEADAQHQLDVRNRVLWVVAGLGILFVAVVGYVMTQAIRRPVRQLIAAANAVANQELPEVVREIERGSDSDGLPVLMPISVSSSDEINDLAEAFDSVRHTAVELAGAQAATRRAAAHMFINLGRRNQALVDRQIAYIDALERSQTDPDVLQSLFRLDHLATRMRRQAESLLVLAGADQPGRWAERVSVYDVIRAALSEVEEYDKVHIAEVEDATVSGNVAADLTHMLAELIENATNFSPPSEPVEVRTVTNGDTFEITVRDRGIGMDSQMVELANQRISGSRAFSVTAASSLGLFVVGRLARRHHIDARLEPTEHGILARVAIPASIIVWNGASGDGSQAIAEDAKLSESDDLTAPSYREQLSEPVDEMVTAVDLPAVPAAAVVAPDTEPAATETEVAGTEALDPAALLDQFCGPQTEVAAAILPARGPLAPVDPRAIASNGLGKSAPASVLSEEPIDGAGDDPDATPPHGVPVFNSFPEISSESELRTADDVRAMFGGFGPADGAVHSSASDNS